MSPEYLRELADLADPGQLWRLNPFEQIKLPEDQRRQLDSGVALRRHASHIEGLRNLIGTSKSMVITPLSMNSSAHMTIPAPKEHKRLLDMRGDQP